MNTQAVINKLQQKGVKPTCRICGGTKQLSTQPVQILVGEGGNLSQTFDGYAFFCNNCGHTDIFNKQYLGV